jgi:hypothetical protein
VTIAGSLEGLLVPSEKGNYDRNVLFSAPGIRLSSTPPFCLSFERIAQLGGCDSP